MKTAALVLNGKMYRGDIEGDYILCADGGYDMVEVKGIRPDAVLGDMDSIISVPDASIEIIRFDPVKDMTDGELGLKFLIDKGFDRIYIYGVEGGRLDHIMSNLNMMYVGTKQGAEVIAKCNDYDVYLANGQFEAVFEEGDELSLVPFSEEVHIISTKGLQYPVHNQTLYRYAARGISNIVTENEVMIEIEKGVCFIFRIYR